MSEKLPKEKNDTDPTAGKLTPENVAKTEEQTSEGVPSNDVEKIDENKPLKTHERTSTCLNPENKGFFGRMSERAKNLADKVYEGLYKIPGVNRVVGKLEIAYNNHWIKNHEEAKSHYKNKMDELDLEAGRFGQSKRELESSIEDLKLQNAPGVASLQLEIRIIDQKIINLKNEKDIAQSKFEARENKTKIYTNERDRVANKFIEGYDKKLQPLEKTLENLETCKDQADLDIAVMEAIHNTLEAKAKISEETKREIENTYRNLGRTEKDIKNIGAVRELKSFLAKDSKNRRLEKEKLLKVKAEINKKIAGVNAEANPYRDKRERFVRIKGVRPIEMDVSIRERGIEHKDTEEITSGTRAENSGGYESSRTYERESSIEAEEETEEDKERLKTQDYISGWNSYLQEKYGKKLPGELINPRDFLISTRLSAEYIMDFKDFKNILTKYYKFRKIPADKLNKSIDKFFTEKIKVRNS